MNNDNIFGEDNFASFDLSLGDNESKISCIMCQEES